MKIESDIFGNHYMGGKKIIPLTLDASELPLAAQDLLKILAEAQVDVNLSRLFAEALDQVDPDFWTERLASATPLEWKVARALQDPGFRAQVQDLLDAFEKRQGPVA